MNFGMDLENLRGEKYLFFNDSIRVRFISWTVQTGYDEVNLVELVCFVILGHSEWFFGCWSAYGYSCSSRSGLVVLDVFDLRQLHGWYAKEITFGPTDADDMNLKAQNNQSTKRLIVTDSFYSTVSLSLKLLNMG
ncbi:hypothetical protein PPTG_14090 [Phytophthora nicotianae INRA-310]|uniref:PiggyBac transposable element-derived protein domain-containing protein n=1 Tax=Phytophthora nicotianae (strain INRA-310) TaxID=761204 RepID=W2PYL3_PHYN3|nr:hypothetical protein PPTG_14090 [Phytophthora nicotianae INRA-310]ETN05329.1 hypothetical protein PPTG_14090 [Phytophthora nicotianae INRA-310]